MTCRESIFPHLWRPLLLHIGAAPAMLLAYPSARPNQDGPYCAYFRDLDGSKLLVLRASQD
jgi:hypothetical protein